MTEAFKQGFMSVMRKVAEDGKADLTEETAAKPDPALVPAAGKVPKMNPDLAALTTVATGLGLIPRGPHENIDPASALGAAAGQARVAQQAGILDNAYRFTPAGTNAVEAVAPAIADAVRPTIPAYSGNQDAAPLLNGVANTNLWPLLDELSGAMKFSDNYAKRLGL